MLIKYYYEYILVVCESFEKFVKLYVFELIWIVQFSVFEGDLSKYVVVVLFNSLGEEFNEVQCVGFECYIQVGGNVVIVYCVIIVVKFGQWFWYEKLVGCNFVIYFML